MSSCGEGTPVGGARENKGLQPLVLPGQIDRLVYELYSLIEDEIKIVEGTGRTPGTECPHPPGSAFSR